jgi:hypothetical protein
MAKRNRKKGKRTISKALHRKLSHYSDVDGIIPHSRLIIRIVTGVARCVSVVGQEQLIRSEYMNSPSIFMGVRVSRPYI